MTTQSKARRGPARSLARGSAALAIAGGISIAGMSGAAAETSERRLIVTRPDGTPIGALFTDWIMVPGDVASTTVVAHRTGGGASSLFVTLGDGAAELSVVESDVIITVASNGIEHSASAAELLRGDAVLDLGRSAESAVPIDVTFELPFSSGNESQRQSMNLSLVVIAADTVAPATGARQGVSDAGTALPNLAVTGVSAREVLIAAAVAACSGLFLIGRRRRRRDESGEPD